MAVVSYFDLSRAVGRLARLAERQLVDFEEATYALGIEPGPDLAFAGIRVLVSETKHAATLLAKLAPHQADVEAVLAAQQPRAQTDPVSV